MSRNRLGKEVRETFSLREEPRIRAWIKNRFGSEQKLWNMIVNNFRTEINIVDDLKKVDRKKP